MTFWDYFRAIAIICLVIIAAFYVTRIIAKSGGGSFRKGSGIKLIGSLPLGKDKEVAVVEIGKHAYVLGVSSRRVERLDKIELSELDIDDETPASPIFSTYFKDRMNSRIKSFYEKK